MSETPSANPSSSEAVVTQKAPFKVEVTAGQKYWWCSCGRSAKQPFCDGSHKGTDFTPMEHAAETDGKVYFCGCRATDKSPLCDGSHNKL